MDPRFDLTTRMFQIQKLLSMAPSILIINVFVLGALRLKLVALWIPRKGPRAPLFRSQSFASRSRASALRSGEAERAARALPVNFERQRGLPRLTLRAGRLFLRPHSDYCVTVGRILRACEEPRFECYRSLSVSSRFNSNSSGKAVATAGRGGHFSLAVAQLFCAASVARHWLDHLRVPQTQSAWLRSRVSELVSLVGPHRLCL